MLSLGPTHPMVQINIGKTIIASLASPTDKKTLIFCSIQAFDCSI